MNKMIFYIQYTNPACYPPLEHSSGILAEKGWKIIFFGTGSFGGSNSLYFKERRDIISKRFSYCPEGWKQKLHYIRFSLWVIWHCLRRRPDWVYASEPLSCPIALALSFHPRIRIIYHEHDSPDLRQTTSKFFKYILKKRKDLASRAALCILPNEKRVKKFINETGRKNDVLCVWNCPMPAEISSGRELPGNMNLTLYYHGNIARGYLPLSILRAMSEMHSKPILRIIGYETIGSLGYIAEIKNEASRLGISKQVEILKPMSRYKIWEHCSRGDIGLALIPAKNCNVNDLNMIGASNKPFDYMAYGLALLVSDLPGWRRMYVEPGYGLACDPEDPEDIARALRRFLEHPEEMRRMGELGRRKILSDWNYEKQFEPVLNRIK